MDYLNLNIPKPRWLLPKLFQERSINFIFGEKGKGKTEFALGLAIAICKAERVLQYEAPEEETPCTFIDGEMDPYDLVQRTTPYIERFGAPKKNYLQLINFALQVDQTIPDIKDEPGQELILKHLKKQEQLTGKKPFLILDNLRSLSNYIENDADSYRPIGVWLKNLRGMGYTTLVIDHTGKAAPGPRGTSSKTDWANVCLKIEPDGPAGQKYMKVKLSFDKARGLRPNETADYVCQYDFEGNWTLAASTKELEDAEYIKQIMELLEQEPKTTQKAIAEKLDISAGKVNKLIKEIKKEMKKEDKVPF
jgi:KaiC/GvpD/RAD55 family RecA-like ATPase